MFSRVFLRDLAERAIATAVQVAIPMIVAVETLDKLDYEHAGLVILTAATLSVLKSIGARLKGKEDSASLVE